MGQKITARVPGTIGGVEESRHPHRYFLGCLQYGRQSQSRISVQFILSQASGEQDIDGSSLCLGERQTGHGPKVEWRRNGDQWTEYPMGDRGSQGN